MPFVPMDCTRWVDITPESVAVTDSVEIAIFCMHHAQNRRTSRMVCRTCPGDTWIARSGIMPTIRTTAGPRNTGRVSLIQHTVIDAPRCPRSNEPKNTENGHRNRELELREHCYFYLKSQKPRFGGHATTSPEQTRFCAPFSYSQYKSVRYVQGTHQRMASNGTALEL